MIKVTVWNENIHDRESDEVKKHYPGGIHGCIAGFLSEDGRFTARTATLEMPEHGLTQEIIDDTDVLIWWGHMGHHLVSDEVTRRVHDAVLKGMGLIVLHSGHMSKPFLSLIGTSGTLRWREGDRERVWCCDPSHPIAQGIPEYFDIPQEEMYGEHFDIPNPESLIFMGWFRGGEVFRSGVTFRRGRGKIFYFQPGHEMYPTFHNPYVRQIIKNGVMWAQPEMRLKELTCPNPPSPEKELTI